MISFSPIHALLTAMFLAVLAGGCVPEDGAPGSIGTPTSDDRCVVDSVTDGDTIRVSGCADEGRIRLLLIDTPEINGPVECYGPEASDYVKGRLPAGTRVRLEAGVLDQDRYGRLLRYVWIGDELLNETIVREGYAERFRSAEDTTYRERIEDAERDAERAGRGLWSACREG